MKKKKVMIIGAGAGQVPLIECCKYHNLETYVVSPNGPYPGINLADTHINEDIYNVNKLIEIGKKEKISFVISDQSDYAVPIVAKISHQLNLPGNLPEVAEIYSDKSKFREFCDKNNIPSPKAVNIDKDLKQSNYFTEFSFPILVKPSDSQGSRGISKVNTPHELQNAIDLALSYSKKGKVVIEEFYKGREVVCEGFVINGEYHNIAFGDREYFNIENKFIPSKTIFPSIIDDHIKKTIIENEKKISNILKPNFGIVHSEYIIDKNGKFIIVESALRGGGVYISSHLIPYSTGINLTELLIQSMMGNKDLVKQILTTNKNDLGMAEYLCFYLQKGQITKILFNRDNISPFIKLIEIDRIKEGDIVDNFEHKGQRKGPILIQASTKQELQTAETWVRNNLVIEVDDANGIVWT